MTPYIFPTYISGIPCQCRVMTYIPARAMQVVGPGFGDANPPEDEVIEFEVLDRKGYKAAWLERKLQDTDHIRLRDEYHTHMREELYGLVEEI